MTNEPCSPAQAAVLALFGLDSAEDLSPTQKLRLEIATTIKALFDAQSTQVLDGKNVDPVKLLAVVDALTKLTPAPPPPPPPQQESGREALARLIQGHCDAHQDEQAELIDQLRAEIEALRAMNERLRAAAGQPVREPAMEVLPPPPKALPPPEQQQQDGDAVARANAQVPRSWLKSNQVEPWNEFFSDDVSHGGRRRWQPT